MTSTVAQTVSIPSKSDGVDKISAGEVNQITGALNNHAYEINSLSTQVAMMSGEAEYAPHEREITLPDGQKISLPISYAGTEGSPEDRIAGLQSGTDQADISGYPVPIPPDVGFDGVDEWLDRRHLRTWEINSQTGFPAGSPQGANFGLVRALHRSGTAHAFYEWIEMGSNHLLNRQRVMFRGPGGRTEWRTIAYLDEIEAVHASLSGEIAQLEAENAGLTSLVLSLQSRVASLEGVDPDPEPEPVAPQLVTLPSIEIVNETRVALVGNGEVSGNPPPSVNYRRWRHRIAGSEGAWTLTEIHGDWQPPHYGQFEVNALIRWANGVVPNLTLYSPTLTVNNAEAAPADPYENPPAALAVEHWAQDWIYPDSPHWNGTAGRLRATSSIISRPEGWELVWYNQPGAFAQSFEPAPSWWAVIPPDGAFMTSGARPLDQPTYGMVGWRHGGEGNPVVSRSAVDPTTTYNSGLGDPPGPDPDPPGGSIPPFTALANPPVVGFAQGSASLTVPSGIVTGDLMVLVASVNQGTGKPFPILPDGWSFLTASNSTIIGRKIRGPNDSEVIAPRQCEVCFMQVLRGTDVKIAAGSNHSGQSGPEHTLPTLNGAWSPATRQLTVIVSTTSGRAVATHSLGEQIGTGAVGSFRCGVFLGPAGTSQRPVTFTATGTGGRQNSAVIALEPSGVAVGVPTAPVFTGG